MASRWLTWSTALAGTRSCEAAARIVERLRWLRSDLRPCDERRGRASRPAGHRHFPGPTHLDDGQSMSRSPHRTARTSRAARNLAAFPHIGRQGVAFGSLRLAALEPQPRRVGAPDGLRGCTHPALWKRARRTSAATSVHHSVSRERRRGSAPPSTATAGTAVDRDGRRTRPRPRHSRNGGQGPESPRTVLGMSSELLGLIPRVGPRQPVSGQAAQRGSRSSAMSAPDLRPGSLGGNLVDGGVVGVQPLPVRRQHFQRAQALPLPAVDQL